MNTVFRPQDEKLNLALTLLAIVFIVGEFSFGWKWYVGHHYTLINLVVSLLLFEAFHVVLTFIGVLLAPSAQRWVIAFTDGKRWKFWLPLAGLFIFSFLLVFLSMEYGTNSKEESSDLARVLAIAVALFTLHHRISQNQGISLSYARLLETQQIADQGPGAQKHFLRRFEKMGFSLLLLFSAVLYLTSFNFPELHHLLGLKKIFQEVSRKASMVAALVSASLVVLLAIYQYLKHRNSPGRGVARNKMIYSLRTVFYPLAPFCYSAFLATETLHGSEYVLLWHKLSHGFSLKSAAQNLKIYLFAAILLTVVYYLVTYSYSIAVPALSGKPWLRLSLSLYMATTLTHFYADRMLFRMKNPASRSIIGSLIVGP